VAILVPLFDHLIRPLEERRRDRQAEGLGGLEIDDQLELGGLRLSCDWSPGIISKASGSYDALNGG
jgi:hypothetical protein